jgi:hypothetical protein
MPFETSNRQGDESRVHLRFGTSAVRGTNAGWEYRTRMTRWHRGSAGAVASPEVQPYTR